MFLMKKFLMPFFLLCHLFTFIIFLIILAVKNNFDYFTSGRRPATPLKFFYILLVYFLLLFVNNFVCYQGYRAPIINYPKDTQFLAADFFVRGCKNFIEKCPSVYKSQHICARNYNGDFRDFSNYCDMQYENCNTWRNWRVFKREKC